MSDDPRLHRGIARQLELRARRIAGGEHPIGWKAGFGSASAMARFGLDGPLVGFLTNASIIASGGKVSIARWTRPVAEPELAVYLGNDLEGGADEGAVRAAITGVAPSIELADVALQPQDLEEILAGNIFHRSVILGDPDGSRSGADLEGLTASITVNGSLTETSELEVLTGRVPAVIAHLAALLGAHGESLRAGEVVICGSLVPPIDLRPGDRVVFELTQFDPISVELG